MRAIEKNDIEFFLKLKIRHCFLRWPKYKMTFLSFKKFIFSNKIHTRI